MKCKLCEQVTKKIYTLEGVRTSRKINAYYCKSCKIYFCDVSDYDYQESDPHIIQYYEKARTYIESRQHKIFDVVKNSFFPQPGVFLDVGSGIGYSLIVAQELDWHAVGVEPNTVLQEYSRNILNLNTLNNYLSADTTSSIRELLPEGYADYILIDNVLEHIPDPVEFFQNVLSLLKEGGLLLTIVPPVDWFRLALTSLSSVRDKSSSAQINLFYDPEQHVNYFSRKAMKVLTEKVGGCELTNFRFHHSPLLNNWLARILKFETGYYFIVKGTS